MTESRKRKTSRFQQGNDALKSRDRVERSQNHLLGLYVQSQSLCDHIGHPARIVEAPHFIDKDVVIGGIFIEPVRGLLD
jgi:hypothetical protein